MHFKSIRYSTTA